MQPGVLPLSAVPNPQAAQQGSCGHGDCQQLQQGHPVHLAEAQVAQQVKLPLLRVVEHPVVPAGVGGFPHIAQALQAALQRTGKIGAEGINGIAYRTARLQAGQIFHARGRNGCRGVDTHPALAFEPDFCPGVGIALAHGPHAVHGVDFAALVAGDDAGGNLHIAHQHHKGVGNVLAKALFAVEPEGVSGMLARNARCQCVGIAANPQGLEHGFDLFFGRAVGQPGIVEKTLRQLARARIQPRR